MKPRIYGLETEYGIRFLPAAGSSPKRVLSSTELVGLILAALDTRYPTLQGLSKHDRDGNIEFGRSVRFLENGGKFYLDPSRLDGSEGHPEWATPECRSVEEVIAYDKAGELILLDILPDVNAQAQAAAGAKGEVVLYKNNVDSYGHVFGCHESYLVHKLTHDWSDWADYHKFLSQLLIPFLVSRQILCGAGRLVLANGALTYSLSQKAHAIVAESRDETIDEIGEGRWFAPRGIFDTRTSQNLRLSDLETQRRLHLSLGDSNLCEKSSYLKLSTTALILEAAEDDAFNPTLELTDPVAALRTISADPTCRTEVPMVFGSLTAIEIQEWYIRRLRRYLSTRSDQSGWHAVLTEWEDTLRKLKENPAALVGTVDWVTKRWLMNAYLQRQGITWEQLAEVAPILEVLVNCSVEPGAFPDQVQESRSWSKTFLSWLRGESDKVRSSLQNLLPKNAFAHLNTLMTRAKVTWEALPEYLRHYYNLRQIDLDYHRLDRQQGLFYRLDKVHKIQHVVSPASVAQAREVAPATRAQVRSRFIRAARQENLEAYAYWSVLRWNGPEGWQDIWIEDPFKTSNPELDDLVARLERR